MIRSITLENFRRHASTEIDFSSEAQIVAITGRNGAGKSTILEAILFALYGESRHGRRHLAGMVRRGAEHEGMGVTCEFTVAGQNYRVERRWEKAKHSAALYANDTLHTQTADGVTGAITALLGMDSVGFRLATIAKQKELDGLADMRPSDRRKTISRLLRLDAVSAAALQAREQHRRAKDAAAALAGAADIEERRAALSAAVSACAEAEAAHADAAKVVADLDTQIGASSDVETEYHQAQLAASRAEAARDAAAAEHDRAAGALARHQVPPAPMAAQRPDAEIVAELAEVNDTIATGRAQQALVNQLSSSRNRLTQTVEALDRLRGERDQLDQRWPQGCQDEAAAVVTATETQVAQLRSTLDTAIAAAATAEHDLGNATDRLRSFAEVGATCDTCGQDVADEHRASTEAALQNRIADLTGQVERAKEQAAQCRREVSDLEQQLREQRRHAAAAAEGRQEVAALMTRIREGERAENTYRAEIGRLEDQVVEIDLDAAYAAKTRLEAEKAHADEVAHAQLVHDAAAEKQRDLATARDAAATRLQEAEKVFAAAAPGQDLVLAWEKRQEIVATRTAERELLEALSADVAGCRARVEGCEQQVADAARIAEKVTQQRTQAEIAAKTSTLLDGVARKLATQIRPQLEGRVSALLQQMSEGRFTGVKVSDDYDISVCDHDGRYYPVSEFSGGEADLIALAIRLALAQVVAARHGAGGAGFLILDEVFGSQDDGRRNAILEALRRLRGVYGQILLISHVGGVENAADAVLEVGKDDDEEAAAVAVLAG